jgi:hypothetical protein
MQNTDVSVLHIVTITIKKKLVSKNVLTCHLYAHKWWDICILFYFGIIIYFHFPTVQVTLCFQCSTVRQKIFQILGKNTILAGPNCYPHYQNKELEVGRTNALYRRLGGLRGRSGRARKISPPPAVDPPTTYAVASRHTHCTTPTAIPTSF